MKDPVHITSLIKLKKDLIEQYVILHKHTFPGVLDRIAKSNIKNYSIFLYEDLLFSHYEYCGENFKGDMDSIADDITKEWWKLTDYMQIPIQSRKEGEWWATAEVIYQYDNPKINRVNDYIKRFTFKLSGQKEINIQQLCNLFRENIADKKRSLGYLLKLIVSSKDDEYYIYIEIVDENNLMDETIIESMGGILKQLNNNRDVIRMSEVFYTDISKDQIRKRVFVTGCFDMLHSGHVAFLQEASSYGDLYVCIGSDENVYGLKGRYPVNNQDERVYMIKSLKYVKDCYINRGFGIIDFLNELEIVKPDIFFVNEDGNSPAKAELCEKLGINYIVSKRVPHKDLPRRSTTELRKECTIPYRIDIAGGWLDQPYVSKYYPGSVITISIEPTLEFNERSGMASSTRRKAVELWKTEIPQGNKEQLAKVLFTFDNPPGTKNVSGSQDSLGIVLPGINKLSYNGDYWPESIQTINDEDVITWLENSLYLVTLGPRGKDYDVLDNTRISIEGAKALAVATEGCWNAIKEKNIIEFGRCFRESFEAQIAMFPNMVDSDIMRIINSYSSKTKGWKLSGAGGGGYIIFVADKTLDEAIKIKIRRNIGY